jgi:hypothetical protein
LNSIVLMAYLLIVLIDATKLQYLFNFSKVFIQQKNVNTRQSAAFLTVNLNKTSDYQFFILFR